MSRIDTLLRQLTLANQLTLLRLAAVPFLALALLYGRPMLALCLYVAASITDRLDGMAARRFGQTTALGAFLDPAADKLMMLVTYIVLAMPDGVRSFPEFVLAHHIPAWLTVLVVARDVLIVLVAVGMYLHASITEYPPTRLGKWTAGWEMVNGGVFLLANVWDRFPVWLLVLGVATTAGIVFLSGVQYLVLLSRRLREH